MRNVLPEEIERAQKNISIFADMKDYMEEDWLNSHLQVEERYKKHPIFWILIDSSACSKLSNNLTISNSCCSKIQRIVNKLKSDKDRFNFHSLLTEIDVIAHYYSRYNAGNIEYEPEIQEKNKKVDAKLVINGDEYYLEILTVFEDEVEQSINRIHDEIRKRIDELNQPFIISFSTEINFTEQDVAGFLEFVKKLLTNKNSIKDEDSFDYLKDTKKIARVTFYVDSNIKKGFVGFMHQPVRTLNSAGRIKNKILSKIDQLPENTKNIVIVNLSYISNDFIDIEDAFLGQSCVIINKETLEAKASRHPNGIINHEKGKFISMIIAYTSQDYNTRRFYLNLSAQNVIDKEITEKL